MVSIANTLGVGSGVDTQALIDALVAADRKPREDALKLRSDKATARVSGMAQVTSALDALVSAMASRTRNGALGPLPASTDSGIVAARSLAGATRALQPTSVEVLALAGGQTLVSGALAAPGATVGQGILSITLGTLTPDGQGDFGFAGAGDAVEITIGPGDDSLTGLAVAINRSGAGVRASIVDDGNGARLVLKGPTGAKSAFIVTASGDAGLDRFVHRPGLTAMTGAGTAQDARLVVDGITVTRPSNTITDLIGGVGLEIGKTGTVTIAASRDTAGLATAVADLVDAVNALHGLTATLTRSGEGSGALAGDATLRQLERNLAALTTGAGLAALGVSTQRDGTMTVDSAKLSAALARDPDGAEALLAGLSGTNGALTKARGAIGTDSRLAREQRAISTAQARMENSTTTLRAQLTRQYAAMERAVGGFKATQSFLDQQIKAWNSSDN